MSIISALIILPFPFAANSALSATTSKTIQGTAPRLKSASQENRLGFTVDGKFYSESSSNTVTTGNIVSGTPTAFNGSLKFTDFIIKTLSATDFTVENDYEDEDGDIARTLNGDSFTVGSTTYKWTDNSGNAISSGSYGKTIGCGSGYSQPLRLIITLSDVQVHSEYGDPRDSTLTNLTKTYQINSTTGICHVKPNQMLVDPTQTWRGWNGSSWAWNSGSSSVGWDGGGYSVDFDPVNGFRASASTKFPTTGFPKAKFQLVMTGAQTDWTYAVPTNPGGGVSVDSNGNVTLNSKPTGTGDVIVSATSKNLTPQVTHTYKFNPTTNGWFVPKSGASNYATAINICGAANIPTRSDLTNSPRNTGLNNINWSWVYNSYTRAIGKGVFNEWGRTDNRRYPGSQWVTGDEWVTSNYWTGDVYATGSVQFVVGCLYGDVGYLGTSVSPSAVCRE